MGTQFYARTAEARCVIEVEPPSLNVRSAWGLFALLGSGLTVGKRVGPRLDPQHGTLTVPEARRAILAARARFDVIAPALVAELTRLWDLAAPGAQPFGALELRVRLEKFATFVETAAARGATRIEWS